MIPFQPVSYCLACHKVMLQPEPVCPRCGADQEETKAALRQPRPEPPPLWNLAARRRMPPPLPLNAVEAVQCPSCHCWVAAGAPSCSYCGHAMLTDLPKWKTDGQDARPALIGAYVCSAAIIVLVLAGQFFLGLLFGIPALVLAMFAHGKNPLGFGGVVAIGVSIAAIVSGLLLIAGMVISGKGG